MQINLTLSRQEDQDLIGLFYCLVGQSPGDLCRKVLDAEMYGVPCPEPVLNPMQEIPKDAKNRFRIPLREEEVEYLTSFGDRKMATVLRTLIRFRCFRYCKALLYDDLYLREQALQTTGITRTTPMTKTTGMTRPAAKRKPVRRTAKPKAVPVQKAAKPPAPAEPAPVPPTAEPMPPVAEEKPSKLVITVPADEPEDTAEPGTSSEDALDLFNKLIGG